MLKVFAVGVSAGNESPGISQTHPGPAGRGETTTGHKGGYVALFEGSASRVVRGMPKTAVAFVIKLTANYSIDAQADAKHSRERSMTGVRTAVIFAKPRLDFAAKGECSMKKVIWVSAILGLMFFASSISSFQGGNWYGYANGACCLDRENELRQHWGNFTRITVPYNGNTIYPVTLDAVCIIQHKTCLKVGDWEGKDFGQAGCTVISQNQSTIPQRDGSRIALCSAQ
jgi:hypothetical protein